MPRNKCRRRVGINPEITCFKAQGISKRNLGNISLELDEIESLRLKDLSELNQEECARRMNISTSTFQRILNSAHQKVAQALLGGKSIIINSKLCQTETEQAHKVRGQKLELGKVAQNSLNKSTIINQKTMPNRNGTGPAGQGSRTGRSQGNCAVNSNRNQSGPGGNCICPKCGEKVAHTTGQACYLQKCSKCSEAMIREA